MIDYKYLGGSYGKCDELLMIEELKTNGPFVVSFESDVNFIYYKSGIYHSLEQNNQSHDSFFRSEWNKIDHSVLLVGWGILIIT
jgi:cathepsin C